MKIFDCFMYFDEDLVLDVRLNLLNDFVDKFVIIESNMITKEKKESHSSILENLKNLKIKLHTYKKTINQII